MATNVAWLPAAAAAAGFRTDKALADMAGMNPGSVSRIMRSKVCNSVSARKLQTACGQFAIGPDFGSPPVGSAEEAKAPVRERIPGSAASREGYDARVHPKRTVAGKPAGTEVLVFQRTVNGEIFNAIASLKAALAPLTRRSTYADSEVVDELKAALAHATKAQQGAATL